MKNLCRPDRCAHVHTLTRFSTVFGFFFNRLLSPKGFSLSEMIYSIFWKQQTDRGFEFFIGPRIRSSTEGEINNKSRTDEPPTQENTNNPQNFKNGSIQVICVTQCFHQCTNNNVLSAQIHKSIKENFHWPVSI